MARPRLAVVTSSWMTFRSLMTTFWRQRLGRAIVLVIVIFLLALIFAFLAFTPVLSPFVYPLF